MCTKSFFRRFGAFVAALVLCFALSVPVFAADFTGGFTFSYNWLGAGWTFTSTTLSSPVNSKYVYPSSGNSLALRQFYTTSENATFSGFVKLYLSFVPATKNTSSTNQIHTVGDFYSASSYRAFYWTSEGQKVYVDPELKTFTPVSPYSDYGALGITLSSSFEGSQDSPIHWIGFEGIYSGNTPTAYFYYENEGSCFYFTSARAVSSNSSAELSTLEDIANGIAAQSQILSQFYGDIVAVCNQIYQRLGDLQATQEEANALFANVIKLLNTTNGKLEAINMAMSTYFELLINQLKQEGIDTRTAIADAEARLELYLKPMIDYFNELEEQTGESASTLPQHKQDIDGFNNDGFGIDSDGQTGLTAILPIFTAFSFILSVLGIFVGLGVLKIIIKKGLS